MEGTALNRAYTASMEADLLAQRGDFHSAAKFLIEAAEAFEEVLKSDPNTHSARTLRALSKQHRDQADYIQKENTQISRRPQACTPSFKGDKIQSSPSADCSSPSTPNTNGLEISSYAERSIGTLFQRATTAFIQDFQHSITPTAPTDSFYLAAPTSNSSSSPHRVENAINGNISHIRKTVYTTPVSATLQNIGLDQSEAVDHAVKAMKKVLKSELSEIINEIISKEQLIHETNTATVDRIRAENDQLHIEVTKLKERWDSLKESAKKRRQKQDSEANRPST